MTFHYRYRKQIIIGVFMLFIFLFLTGYTTYLYFHKNESKDKVDIKIKKTKVKKVNSKASAEYKVDIKGEINIPGIYSIASNFRIMDVIERAGGLTNNADTSVINLSKKIEDEMVIIIYSYEQVKNFKKVKEEEKLVLEKCRENDQYDLVNDACISSGTNNISTKISINNATVEQLQKLPGIGEAKAKDIILYREKNGLFTAVEDLLKVPGIGDATFVNIKENITL